MIKIRLFDKNDWPAVWQIIGPVFRAGETYPFSTEISEEEAYTAWIALSSPDCVRRWTRGDTISRLSHYPGASLPARDGKDARFDRRLQLAHDRRNDTTR